TSVASSDSSYSRLHLRPPPTSLWSLRRSRLFTGDCIHPLALYLELQSLQPLTYSGLLYLRERRYKCHHRCLARTRDFADTGQWWRRREATTL
ncbi:hypothetical protein V8E54_003352, partial [Elaphomyces granulatus]